MSQDFVNILGFFSIVMVLVGLGLYICFSFINSFRKKSYDDINLWTKETEDILSIRTPNMFIEYDPSYGMPNLGEWSTTTITATKRKRAKHKQRKPSYMGKDKRNYRKYISKMTKIGFI